MRYFKNILLHCCVFRQFGEFLARFLQQCSKNRFNLPHFTTV